MKTFDAFPVSLQPGFSLLVIGDILDDAYAKWECGSVAGAFGIRDSDPNRLAIFTPIALLYLVLRQSAGPEVRDTGGASRTVCFLGKVHETQLPQPFLRVPQDRKSTRLNSS